MQTVKEKPILFSAPMVRAILDGRKTQTRRIVRYPRSWLTPYAGGDKNLAFGLFHAECVQGSFWNCGNPKTGEHNWQCADERLPQNYQVENRLWVKETYCWMDELIDGTSREDPVVVGYKADNAIYRFEPLPKKCAPSQECPEGVDGWNVKWRPSIFMPRWASRITLEITGVRVERLQDISTKDAFAEGIEVAEEGSFHPNNPMFANAVRNYQLLWESINGPGSWALNPWVWVITFKKL